MSAPLVFAYGSLVSAASVAETLGDGVEVAGRARLRGWRRRWRTIRDNLACEKTFAPSAGGEPFQHCLGLTVEPAEGEEEGANGVLLRLDQARLDRLDLREMRYRRERVTEVVESEPAASGEVVTYVARTEHRTVNPPPGTVVLASYVRAVEAAFAELGGDELDRYRRTTDAPPVEVVEAALVSDLIPAGNPRAW